MVLYNTDMIYTYTYRISEPGYNIIQPTLTYELGLLSPLTIFSYDKNISLPWPSLCHSEGAQVLLIHVRQIKEEGQTKNGYTSNSYEQVSGCKNRVAQKNLIWQIHKDQGL